MSENPRPPIRSGSQLALWVDQNGLTVYGNKAGLISLAERLLRIAEANPDERFECHTRSELGDIFEHDRPGDVSLIKTRRSTNIFLASRLMHRRTRALSALNLPSCTSMKLRSVNSKGRR
jgi:hypothetical protein